jgi:hypothetical protein
MTTVIDPPPETPVVPKAAHACANCGSPMHGPYCYACGQPEKGLIRHLASVMSDVLDTVFNIDSRVFRSLFPLYFRPGYLTNEYFAGRRVRYVTPFRLFFFLCLVAFFTIQISLNLNDGSFHWNLNTRGGDIESAQTVEQAQKSAAEALAGINTARKSANMPPAAIASLTEAADKVEAKLNARVAYLQQRDKARENGQKPPSDPSEDNEGLVIDGTPIDPDKHPVNIAWLPSFANAELTEMASRAKENIEAAKKDPRHLIEAVFSRLPWTLAVLMPLFAVLLKIVYIFKRRLYMEHLMVALHSHAFIFMSLLLLALLKIAHDWAAASAPGVLWLIALARDAAWIWLFVYLFLMQKRVYKQGWIMTTIKYGMVGICYTIIVVIGLAGALLASLTLA